ncbi:MAG: nucleotidyltransferase family protein [Marinilabiliales bacterium]|nr:nucleotidyltransferase family protein [Marinilabiliales bacterium]
MDALVYNNLEKLGFTGKIPEQPLHLLRNTLMMSINRNAHNTEMLSEVLNLLNHENIKTVLLKGSALELMVYGNSGLRQMTDVDVFFH